jgi:Arc/MetJ-type ribon-helix-helix transcriptional regulator
MTEPLPPDLADFVSAKISTGEFTSVDDVAIAALRHYRDTEDSSLERLRDSIQLSRDQIARGECLRFTDREALKEYFEDVKRRGRAALEKEQGQSCSD